MIEFAMPALGSDMDEGTLDEWLIRPGDSVTRGQVVAVVETTKAAVEIECWQEGIVTELLVPVGETVRVGTVLATLAESSDAAPAPATPSVARADRSPVEHRRYVSPAARRLAASRHVDLDSVSGSGPQGAVTIRDVESAAVTVEHEPPPSPQPAGTTRSAFRRASIAAAMGRSKREIPHYYLADDVSMARALTWLTERNATRPITERVLPAVLHLKAVALAAQRFPEFNGFWRDDDFQPSSDVHVGVAISLRGGGLVAPAIHDVPNKKLDDLMRDLSDLVARCRAGSLRSSEMSDPTITVTNLGDRSVDTVFGVIYPPQVALVGFGTPSERVRVVDGGIRIVNAVTATLSADHRVSDGHRGAMFLAAVNELLQQPDELAR